MERFYYLFHIQYLGFRYHGWQKQPGVKTVEMMVEKTTREVLGHSDFRILGASRTDSKVSANHSAFELFTDQKMTPDALERQFNRNLPNDIRVLKVEPVGPEFNIIQAPKLKEYLYLFASGGKGHPYSASLVCSFQEDLNIDRMKEGARLFEGTHNFKQYCTKPSPNTVFKRTVDLSVIEKNSEIQASFFPSDTWRYKVQSKGFMRNQVRLMMGQLLRLGQGDISLDDIRHSLAGHDTAPLPRIAPASGLILHRIEFGDNAFHT
jgi:tRNA pseudouridine38-40 synthase